MSTTSNVYSQGGGGTHYEFEVQTGFFIAFLLECEIPGLPMYHITEFRQQASSLGYSTDDLLLKCSSNNSSCKAFFQIKHNIIISEKSELFKETLESAWKDFKNASLFNPSTDKIYLIKSAMTLSEKNHLRQLLNWAKLKSNASDFINEVSRIKEKNNYYLLFKKLLSQIDAAITDEELFAFFKCFDIVEYDFGNESSVSKTNFLSLLQLSRSSDEFSATSIWNEIFSFVSNSDSKGGQFTVNSIPDKLSAYFDKKYYSQSQRKLHTISKQNSEILELIDDTIGVVHLNRQNIIEKAFEIFNKNQILILAGDPGVGKSAVAKTFINNIRKDNHSFILYFKADQLNISNLRDLFLPFDIQLSITELFSHFPLYSTNVIYIDAAEKLLEGEGFAFKQLLKAVKNLPVKLVISCRKANLNLIELKFFNQTKYEILNVPALTENELVELTTQLPILKRITTNGRLLSLIRIPKYLDYAFKAISISNDDYANINEVEFINKLWEIIIENRINDNHSGLPSKRSKLFIEIAVLRSKLMQPFIIPPLTHDDVTLDKLEKDNVIVQSTQTGFYAPAHDVLEDWALIRYVNGCFFDMRDDNAFFTSLGTDPAMRRAYRLWVQSALKEKNDAKIKFFTRNLNNAKLYRFWKDESLIAVLNSDYCGIFFEKNLSLLIADGWKLFFQVVHVMRTACREKDNNKNVFIPTGNGWANIINIIDEHITEIPQKYFPLIIHTISDWANIVFNASISPAEIRPAGKIVLYLLNNYFKSQGTYYYKDDDVETCIKLLFNLCGGIPEEMRSFLASASKKAVTNDENSNRVEVRFSEKILELALSGLHATQLCRYLPDSVLLLLNKIWYRKPKKPISGGDSIAAFLSEHSWDDVNYHFGLVREYKLGYFPASAYQTPVLWLLRNHPIKGLDFIIELINKTTVEYIRSEFAKRDDCIEIELTLDDGTKISQHGSYVLWLMYRGTGKVTPYLLQSVLMALEHYLIEVGEWGDDFKDYFQQLLRHLYVKSKSVAITSVIASVCMAYPVMAGKQILPLYTNRILLSWDVVRYTHDLTPFHIPSDNPAFDEERLKSDKLSHRKISPGLQGFIVHYCFNIALYNRDLFNILDEHRRNANVDDILWRKKIDEMDIRTWRPSKEYSEGGKKGFLIEPYYSEELKEQVEEWNKERYKENIIAGYKLLLMKAQKREENISIGKWHEIYSYYRSLESYSVMDHTPGTLAFIGIRDLWAEIGEKEKEWSVLCIIEIIQKSIDKQYIPYHVSWDYSPYDIDSAMIGFPFITLLPEIQIEKEKFDKLFIRLLITHYQINDPHYKLFLKAIDNSLWEIAPADAMKFFKGLIAFAKFNKGIPFYIDHRNSEEQIEEYNKKFNSFIDDAFQQKFSTVIDDFNYKDYSKEELYKAILIVPTINPNDECIKFLKRLLNFWIQNEISDENSGRYDQLDHHVKSVLEDKLSAIVFWNAKTIGGDLMEYLINTFFRIEILNKTFNRNNIWSFYTWFVKKLILIADNNLPDNNPEKLSTCIENFRRIWINFEAILSRMSSPVFSHLLLLDIEWNESASQWKPIDEMGEFFEGAIAKYGANNISSVFNLLSHVGDKTLLPKGLKLLVSFLRNYESKKTILSYKYSVKLMQRLYDNHISEIMNEKGLLEDYLWMLDEMISEGSSDAYWVREFIVSFRHN